MPASKTKSKEKDNSKILTQPKKKNFELPFLIGSDPEFLVFFGHNSTPAADLFANYLGGRAKLKTVPIDRGGGYEIGDHGNVGWDGHIQTGEIRPTAEKTVQAHVKHIGEILKTVHEHIPFISISTLSITSTVGGHIQLDGSEEMWRSEARKSRITKLLATFLMPILASEHKICTGSRGGQYGKLEDNRFAQRGSNWVWEVRGPSAEWIVTEKIATATLAYISAVWQEIIHRDVALMQTEVALKTTQQIQGMYTAILSDYRPVRDGIIKSVAETVRGFEFYKEFKDEIEFILDYKSVFEEKKKHGWDPMRGWGFDNAKTPTKKDLLATKKVAEKAKQINMDLMDTSFSVSFNDDYNVSLFADALTERIAALGWKLKKEYYLFGLKKGVQGYLAHDAETKNFYSMPTNKPKEQTVATVSKMRDKYQQGSRFNMLRIDPKTGFTRSSFRDVVIIGLPYNLRQKKDIKSLIDLIWRIESNKLIHKSGTSFPEPEIETKKEEVTSGLEGITTATVPMAQPSEVSTMAFREQIDAKDYAAKVQKDLTHPKDQVYNWAPQTVTPTELAASIDIALEQETQAEFIDPEDLKTIRINQPPF